MSEARFDRADDEFLLQVAATVSGYEVWQLPSGEAAFLNSADAVSSGAQTDNWVTRGKVRVDKATSVVLLAGQDVWWDHSANQATYKPVNDQDFRLGTAVEDATSTDLQVIVDLNKARRDVIDVGRDACLSTTAGTAAAGGFDRARRIGGCHKLLLSATNEAQKVDLLSVDGRAPAANLIVEAVFRVVSGGAAGAPDFNIGLANGTHATDADSITEHLFIHLNGNDTKVYAQSKDSITTVAATDTTVTFTAGSAVANRVHVLFDTRNPADVQVYVNGALVLGATVFKLDNATGPLFLLAHLEKTAATDQFEVDVDTLRAWSSEQ